MCVYGVALPMSVCLCMGCVSLPALKECVRVVFLLSLSHSSCPNKDSFIQLMSISTNGLCIILAELIKCCSQKIRWKL